MAFTYDSERDYPTVLEAASQAGEVCIARILRALGCTPADNFNGQNTPDMRALDRDICRAWKELGYRNN